MFDTLRHSYQLWVLQRGKRSSSTHYDRLIAASKARGASANEIEALSFEDFDAATEFDDDIATLHSKFLIQQAQVFLVPVPEYSNGSGQWEESRFTGQWRLSQAEQAKLRSAIRTEQKESWEAWTRWAPLLGILTGLGGVVVAILALIHKW
jgi:hypothetical protein